MNFGKSDNARRNILARIRKAQGRGADSRQGVPASQAELEAVSTYLKAHPRGPLPAVTGDVVANFRARAEAMQSTTEVVASMRDAPAVVARYLAARQLPARGCVWPALPALDWAGAGIDVAARAAVDADLIGITGAFAGIAETGTLMTVSGADTSGSASLLPETHIAIVEARRIVPHMEDAWNLLRAELGRPPRAVNFISGPSRTGDIEQTIVIGAHGPYRVHIVVVGEARRPRGAGPGACGARPQVARGGIMKPIEENE
ncbi:MAG: lactate utilization protein C [Betaproteobacteria bacterium]|nr:lactate utilization protein C [Betaproteobacteria bacterium]